MRALSILLLSVSALGALLLAQGSPVSPQTTQDQLPKRVRVSQGVSKRLLIKKKEPKYPEEARRKGTQGSVVLQVVIGTTGDVEKVQAISGDRLLVEASEEAVKQWKYRPYLLQGEPVEVDTQITVYFTLQ